MIKTGLGITFLVLVTSASTAQTLKQQHAINHAAQAIIGAERCATLVSERVYIVTLLLSVGVDITRSPFEEALLERMRYHNKEAARHAEKSVCMATLALYGPGGQNVPNLVRPK